MDLALIAVGAGLTFWGSSLRSDEGSPSQAGWALLGTGATILVIGAIIFAVAFANGFSQGLQQGG